MISGFNKYYQIAKCYRDEDSRKDRQPEFTQLDLEILNGTPDEVRKTTETIVKELLDNVFSIKVDVPFRDMTYKEAIENYGTDKPDLRITETIEDLSNIFKNTEINFIKSSLENSLSNNSLTIVSVVFLTSSGVPINISKSSCVNSGCLSFLESSSR